MPQPNDADIMVRIATATERGHPLHSAAALAGISPSTAKLWREQGEQEMEAAIAHTETAGKAPEELGSHVAFMLVLKEAEARLMARRLKRIDKAGQRGNWAADMTLLERRFPQDFGRNQTVNVKQESLTVVLHGTLPPGAEHELIAQAHARALAAQVQLEAGGGAENEATPPADTTLPEAATEPDPDSP
jgi:hypothetical protein